MNTQLRVLVVEDSESDARLIACQLQRAGYDLEYERVETAQAMEKALAKPEWDLVIADYHLPRFSGPAALETLKAGALDIPFIVVSATIGEEKAVALMKAGAHDYVMKDNLARLAPAVERELREAAGRRERRRAEAALVKSEATLNTIIKGSPTGIGLVVYRVFEWVNDKLLDLIGYSQEELIGQKTRMLYFSEAEYKRVGNVTGTQIQENGWAEVETQWRRKDGSCIEIYVNTVAVEPGDLSAGVVFTALDITERKQAEEALRESEELFRSLFENMLNGFAYHKMFFKDNKPQDYVFLEVNNAFETVTGLQDVIGKKASEVIPGLHESDPGLLELYGRVALTGEPERFETYVKAMKMWFAISVYSPKKEYFVTIFEQITARKQAEQKLRESEEKYRLVFENVPLGIMHYDQTSTITDCNAKFAEIIGAPKEKFIGFNMIRQIRDDQMRVAAAASLKGEVGYYEGDYRSVTAGKLTPVRAIYQPISSSGGLVLGGVSIFEDITARKQAEEELRLAAQKWRTTFDAMRDAVCLLNREGEVLQCNQAMADLMEQPVPEIIGRSCWEVICGTSAPTEDCPFCRLRRSQGRETLTWKQGDSWWHVTMDPIFTEAGEVVGGVYIIADITVRKLSQDKVQDLNILLRAIKDINESLLRVKSEKELFQRTCDLLLTVPYIRFCWIGLVEPESFDVNPVAWAGAGEGYLSSIKVKWDESELGQGPAGEGLRSGKPVLRGNIATDPAPNPWRQEALERGYQSSISLPLIHEGLMVGILNVYSEIPDIFREEEIDFLNQVAGDIAVGVKSLRLEQEVIASLIKMKVMMIQTVETIGAILEVRDPYTAGHQRGVSKLACALGNELGLNADRLEGLRVAGLLHDIGKIVVPAEILNRPGKLSEFEMNIIKIHPEAGCDILKKISFPWPVAQIVLQHHERLNGSGYPHGLAEPDILLEAKILALADVVEAMASHRPYRPSLGIDAALEEITKNKSKFYDPEMVDACLTLFTKKGFQFD
jgi:PAS domain S-box-containing protein/putative nucleotidyltransferase with HDIG domain